jgi:site-specific DNA recombinase
MRRAFIYLRVSTKGQTEIDFDVEGLSIPAQREACRRKAAEAGAVIVGEYIDRGESAKTANRPELARMLADLCDQEIDFVIVHKLDRLARSRADDVAIVMAIQQAGAQLVSVSENVDDSPSGKLMHGVMATIAEFYSSNLAQEAKKGMRQKAKNGGTPTRAPFGYANVRATIDGREVRTIAVDKDQAHHVRWMFHAFATGEWSVRTLTDEMERRGIRSRITRRGGGKPLSTGSVHKMLRDDYYVGIVTFEGVQYKGRHEPVVELPVWQDVQRILEERRVSQERPARRVHYLKGLLACGLCGSNLGLAYSRGKQGDVYPYFYCLRRQRHHDCELPWIGVAKIEEAVERYWADMPGGSDWLDGVREAVLEHLELAKDLNRDEALRQQDHLSNLEAQSDKLLHAHYADAIDLNQLKAEQDRLKVERRHAEAMIARCTAQYDALARNLNDALARLSHPGPAYQAATVRGRRELLGAVFTKLFVTPEGIGGADLAELYQILLADDLNEQLVRERHALRQGKLDKILDSTGGADAAELLARAWEPTPYERPYGPLTWEKKNPDSRRRRGSNVSVMVGAEGLEPPTSAL